MLDWHLSVDDDQKMVMAQELGYEKMLRQYREDRLRRLERERVRKCEFQQRKTILENKRDIEIAHIVCPQREERIRSEIEKLRKYEIKRFFPEEKSARKDAQNSSKERREREKFCMREGDFRVEIERSMMREFSDSSQEESRTRVDAIKSSTERRYDTQWRRENDIRSCSSIVALDGEEGMDVPRDVIEMEERLCRGDVTADDNDCLGATKPSERQVDAAARSMRQRSKSKSGRCYPCSVQ